MLEPKSPGFNSIKKLISRLKFSSTKDPVENFISVEDRDVPAWQRQVVWNADEMGLLIYSILKGYPIGMIILWQKKEGYRVPIDGRQRITAIKKFFEGLIAIPDLPKIEEKYRNKKYKINSDDEGFSVLSLSDKESFEDYELKCVQYENIDEAVAMDIFVMLQGGKSLTKTEIRGALGGKLCDLITELTSDNSITDEENLEDEVEPLYRHDFFKLLSRNLKNTRKAHRTVADIIVHEILYPDTDKHWSSLEKMYMEKAKYLTDNEKDQIKHYFTKFTKTFTLSKKTGKILSPQLRTAHFILTVFKAWKEIKEKFEASELDFNLALAGFESLRINNPEDSRFLQFTSALSNAGYALNRIQIRHDIFVTYILQKYPNLKPKYRDSKRLFTIEQKIAMWERANHQCEYTDKKGHCQTLIPHPRMGDADHYVKWSKGGETTLKNGRLLCKKHNRGNK